MQVFCEEVGFGEKLRCVEGGWQGPTYQDNKTTLKSQHRVEYWISG